MYTYMDTVDLKFKGVTTVEPGFECSPNPFRAGYFGVLQCPKKFGYSCHVVKVSDAACMKTPDGDFVTKQRCKVLGIWGIPLGNEQRAPLTYAILHATREAVEGNNLIQNRYVGPVKTALRSVYVYYLADTDEVDEIFTVGLSPGLDYGYVSCVYEKDLAIKAANKLDMVVIQVRLDKFLIDRSTVGPFMEDSEKTLNGFILRGGVNSYSKMLGGEGPIEVRIHIKGSISKNRLTLIQ